MVDGVCITATIVLTSVSCVSVSGASVSRQREYTAHQHHHRRTITAAAPSMSGDVVSFCSLESAIAPSRHGELDFGHAHVSLALLIVRVFQSDDSHTGGTLRSYSP